MEEMSVDDVIRSFESIVKRSRASISNQDLKAVRTVKERFCRNAELFIAEFKSALERERAAKEASHA